MKIAVASQNRREITGHTGRCRRFWVYDIAFNAAIAGRELLELNKSQCFHESSTHDAHPLDYVPVLICGGTGNGIQRRPSAMGIEAVSTRETDPDTSVAAWVNDSLEQVPPASGQDHHHDTPGHKGNGHAGGATCGCRSHTDNSP